MLQKKILVYFFYFSCTYVEESELDFGLIEVVGIGRWKADMRFEPGILFGPAGYPTKTRR